MGNPLTIRQLRREDWEAYRAIRLAGLKSDPGVFFEKHDEQVGRPPAAWQKDLSNPREGFLGMFDGDEIIGLIGVTADRCDNFLKNEIRHHPLETLQTLVRGVQQMGLSQTFHYGAESLRGHAAWLGEAYIRPDYRGRGLSAPLYAAAVEWAAQRPDFAELMAAIRKSNGASNAAILKRGFSLICTNRCYWPDGKIDDELVYRRPLKNEPNILPVSKASADDLSARAPATLVFS